MHAKNTYEYTDRKNANFPSDLLRWFFAGIEAHKNFHGEDKIPDLTLQKIADMKEDNPLLMIYKIKW